jgi:hypothetical protein
MSPLTVKVLHQLASLQDASWDPAIVRETVDIQEVVERCAASSDRANAYCKEETGEDSVYAYAAKFLRDTAPNWRVHDKELYLGDAGWSGAGEVDLSATMDFSDDFWLHVPFHS